MLRHAMFCSLLLALTLPTLVLAQSRYESPDPDRFNFDAGDAQSLSRMQGTRHAGDAAALSQMHVVRAQPLVTERQQPAQQRRSEPISRPAQTARPAFNDTHTAPQPVRDQPHHVVASPATSAFVHHGADYHAERIQSRQTYRDGYRDGYVDGYQDGRRDPVVVVRHVPAVVTYHYPVQRQVIFAVGSGSRVSYGFGHTWHGGMNTCQPIFLHSGHRHGVLRAHQPIGTSLRVGVRISR